MHDERLHLPMGRAIASRKETITSAISYICSVSAFHVSPCSLLNFILCFPDLWTLNNFLLASFQELSLRLVLFGLLAGPWLLSSSFSPLFSQCTLATTLHLSRTRTEGDSPPPLIACTGGGGELHHLSLSVFLLARNGPKSIT